MRFTCTQLDPPPLIPLLHAGGKGKDAKLLPYKAARLLVEIELENIGSWPPVMVTLQASSSRAAMPRGGGHSLVHDSV